MVSELELAISKLPRLNSKQSWARSTWLVLWQVIASYPDNPNQDEKNDIRSFLFSLQRILPCKTCQQHFLQHLQSPRFEKALDSRTQLFMFFFHVINDISARTGRPVYTPMEQVRTVEKLINWPATWVMPGPSSQGATQTQPSGLVPWYLLIILGVVALGMGLGFGTLIPKGQSTLKRLK